jgi:hypothetical protein
MDKIRSFWRELSGAYKATLAGIAGLASTVAALGGAYAVICGATNLWCLPPAHSTPTPSHSAKATSDPGPTSLSEKLEKPMPEARQEHAAGTFGSRLYVVGGFDATGLDSDSVFVYYSGAWHGGPRFPAPVDHPSAASVAGRLFVAGGFSNGRATNAVYSLTTDAQVWQPVAPLHHARGALALVAVGDRLYAIGGNTEKGDNVAISEVYDPVTSSWADLPKPMPGPRNHLAGFAHQGKACVAGGRTPDTTRVDCYDPTTDTWGGLPDLPKATSGAGAAALGDSVVVAGGELTRDSQVISQLAWFHQGSWELMSMSLPRHGVQLGVLDGRAWVCGGGSAPGKPHATTTCTSIGPAS